MTLKYCLFAGVTIAAYGVIATKNESKERLLESSSSENEREDSISYAHYGEDAPYWPNIRDAFWRHIKCVHKTEKRVFTNYELIDSIDVCQTEEGESFAYFGDTEAARDENVVWWIIDKIEGEDVRPLLMNYIPGTQARFVKYKIICRKGPAPVLELIKTDSRGIEKIKTMKKYPDYRDDRFNDSDMVQMENGEYQSVREDKIKLDFRCGLPFVLSERSGKWGNLNGWGEPLFWESLEVSDDGDDLKIRRVEVGERLTSYIWQDSDSSLETGGYAKLQANYEGSSFKKGTFKKGMVLKIIDAECNDDSVIVQTPLFVCHDNQLTAKIKKADLIPQTKSAGLTRGVVTEIEKNCTYVTIDASCFGIHRVPIKFIEPVMSSEEANGYFISMVIKSSTKASDCRARDLLIGYFKQLYGSKTKCGGCERDHPSINNPNCIKEFRMKYCNRCNHWLCGACRQYRKSGTSFCRMPHTQWYKDQGLYSSASSD